VHSEQSPELVLKRLSPMVMFLSANGRDFVNVLHNPFRIGAIFSDAVPGYPTPSETLACAAVRFQRTRFWIILPAPCSSRSSPSEKLFAWEHQFQPQIRLIQAHDHNSMCPQRLPILIFHKMMNCFDNRAPRPL
jgi:hypothetical protein